MFPKRQVGCFDRDELIQCVMYIRLGDLPKGFVQREIKELIENERLGELRIMHGDRFHFNIREVVMEPDWSGLYQRQKIYRRFMPVDEGLSTHDSLDRFQYVMSTWIDTRVC